MRLIERCCVSEVDIEMIPNLPTIYGKDGKDDPNPDPRKIDQKQ
jgi:hypothetical protein